MILWYNFKNKLSNSRHLEYAFAFEKGPMIDRTRRVYSMKVARKKDGEVYASSYEYKSTHDKKSFTYILMFCTLHTAHSSTFAENTKYNTTQQLVFSRHIYIWLWNKKKEKRQGLRHYQPNILGMRENTQYAHEFPEKFRESNNRDKDFCEQTGTFLWYLVWSRCCAEYYGFHFHFHSFDSMLLQSWPYGWVLCC